VYAERLRRFRLNKAPSDVDRVLRFVVRSAYANIAAYRRLLDSAAVTVKEIRGVEDLPKLPVVQRDTFFVDTPLAERIHRHADPSKCLRSWTSGTEGIPISVYMSRGEALFRKILLLQAWQRNVPLRFPFTVIDAATSVEPDAEVEVRWQGPIRLVRVPIARLDDVDVVALARHRRAILSGYPTTLTLLLERLGSRSERWPVGLVVSRGEILDNALRASLESVFGCRVMDLYNCEEVGNLAWQCPADRHRLHVNTDACVVEVVDESGVPLPQGTEGRVLVTNLYNCTMPLIRYDLQDRGFLLPASEGPCACGSRRPTMGLVQGREDDLFCLPSGRRISPRLVGTTLEKAANSGGDGRRDTFYRRYQVLQDAPDHITVRIVPIPGTNPPLEETIASAFRRLDPELRCTLDLVDDLPPAASGKLRKVARTFDA